MRSRADAGRPASFEFRFRMFRSACVCAIAVSYPGLTDRFGFPLEYYAAQHVLSDGSESWEKAMNHRGVEFTVAKTAIPGIWQWQFRIGEQIKTGRTETKIDLLAIRRVQLRIDRELKAIGRKTA